MHFAHAFVLLPVGKITHWRFGYFLFVEVGLYLPLSFTSVVDLIDFFPQSGQILDINLEHSRNTRIYNYIFVY